MKASILIADHEAALADAIRNYLIARGYKAEAATTGLQCQELLGTFKPALLVLNSEILWGGGDGILEWLIQEEPLMSPMVIVFSGSGITERLETWVDARIDRPESLSDLLGFVSQLESLAWWSQSPGRDSTSLCTWTRNTGAV